VPPLRRPTVWHLGFTGTDNTRLVSVIKPENFLSGLSVCLSAGGQNPVLASSSHLKRGSKVVFFVGWGWVERFNTRIRVVFEGRKVAALAPGNFRRRGRIRRDQTGGGTRREQQEERGFGFSEQPKVEREQERKRERLLTLSPALGNGSSLHPPGDRDRPARVLGRHQ